MKRIFIILLLTINPVLAEKVEQLSWYNLQELLEDDNLTYKVIKGCVSLNSAVTELIRKEHPNLANEFYKTANFLYPFGILTLSKVKNIDRKVAQCKSCLGHDPVSWLDWKKAPMFYYD